MPVVNSVIKTYNRQLFQICIDTLASALAEEDKLEEVEALMRFVLQRERRHASMVQGSATPGCDSAMTQDDLICWMIADFPVHDIVPWQFMSAAYHKAGLLEQAIATASLIKPSSTLAYANACITTAEVSLLRGDLQVLQRY